MYLANIIKKNKKTDNVGKVLKQPERKNGLLWALTVGGCSLLLALFLWSLYKNKHLKKTDQKKYKQINKQNAYTSSITKVGSKIDISKAKKKSILEQLEAFEKEKKYLDKNLSLDAMAGAFETNNKYISQTIKQEKKKKFSQYINDLRIDWLIESLRMNIEEGEDDETPISKLAENAGFTSIQSFTKYFKLKTGMTVSGFIRKLKAEKYLRSQSPKNIPKK